MTHVIKNTPSFTLLIEGVNLRVPTTCILAKYWEYATMAVCLNSLTMIPLKLT
ncbi:MAG TPA: hypothetical protein VN456_09490 [Desulfosporosinus sp.]|nr:hypothetical protein [Desulfosporosinus sp.]